MEDKIKAWVIINDHTGGWIVAKRTVKRVERPKSERNFLAEPLYFWTAPESEMDWVRIAKSHIHASKGAANEFLQKKMGVVLGQIKAGDTYWIVVKDAKTERYTVDLHTINHVVYEKEILNWAHVKPSKGPEYYIKGPKDKFFTTKEEAVKDAERQIYDDINTQRKVSTEALKMIYRLTGNLQSIQEMGE